MKKYIGYIMSLILMTNINFGVLAEEMEENIPSVSVSYIETDTDKLVENKETEIAEDFEILEEDVQNVSDSLEDDIEPSLQETNSEDISLLSLGPAEFIEWDELNDLNNARADCTLKVIGSELYAIGGYGNLGLENTIEKYNPSTNLWTVVTQIPGDIKGYSVAAYNNSIYFIGGSEGYSCKNSVEVYNILTNEWSIGIPMNRPRSQSASLTVDNKIYVFGGRNAKGFEDSYEYFDLSTNKWNLVTTGYNESLIRVDADAAYINGYVCIYGGICTDYSYGGVNVYNTHNMRLEQEIVSKGNTNEFISMVFSQEKAMILLGGTSYTYTARELTASDEGISVSSLNIDGEGINKKYTQFVLYDGYLYGVGGYYNGCSTKVYKYPIYYGEYSVGDGDIESTVTADGNNISLNVEAGKEYLIYINTSNVDNINNYEFTLEYPDGSFSILDACSFTANKDTQIGAIENTDIYLTQRSTSGLTFTSSQNFSSGTVNVVALTSNVSGQYTLKYSMTQR